MVSRGWHFSSVAKVARSTEFGLTKRAIALLTPAVLLIHGYHPLADDGAVYVTGIKKLVNPALYPSDSIFALAPTHLSIFAHVFAALIRLGHLPLAALLVFSHLLSIYLYLLATLSIAEHIFSSNSSRWGAVLLAACCFTLPVAGTSLSIMDPYVTARSFSTPLGLFALSAALGEQWIQSALWLAFAALLHPLMAIYAALTILTTALTQRRMWRLLSAISLLVAFLLLFLFTLTRHPDLTSTYDLAALSRSYFFLSSWQWYEYLGLVIPLLLLGWAGARTRLPWPQRSLALAITILGAGSLLISMCLTHRSGSLWIARLQPLRAFQWVYLAGVLLAGGFLGKALEGRKRLAGFLYLAIAGALFAGQRVAFASSNHVEWPGKTPRNHWQLAFLWARDHTPSDALFALDNDYIESPGEDAQGFRAVSERSAVADYFKDGGIAANFRQAANLWWQGSQATEKLNQVSDEERLSRLRPLGVSWIILTATSPTGLACPFSNATVRVCRLSPLLQSRDGAK